MHLHELLPALGDVSEVVHVEPAAEEPGAEESGLLGYLRVPEGVGYRRVTPATAADPPPAERGVLVCLLGPGDRQVDPDALAAALAALPAGGTALLLFGWPMPELPYHRLLGPLVGGSCQVLEAIPVEGAVAHHGVHAAAIVRRVERLAAPRPYLTGLRSADAAPEPADLRAGLRMTAEYVLADLVARPMRARLADLERDLAARDARLREAEQALAKARVRLGRLEGSASYRVGQVVVRGARNPARAVVAVPRDLARIWRDRSRRAG